MNKNTETFPLQNPAAIAEAIQVPLNKWPGNCSLIATLVMKTFPIEGQRYARGIWRGPTHHSSIFGSRALSGHSWTVLQDGRILDPTRFAFEAAEPYIYLGPSDFYDEAGMNLRTGLRSSAPQNRLDGNIEVNDRQTQVLSGFQICCMDNRVHVEDLHWVATAPVTDLNKAKPLYEVLEALNFRSLIPIDCWKLVMEAEHLYSKPIDGVYHALALA